MNLTLYRDSKGKDSTIGRLTIGDMVSEYLFCYVVEDEKRRTKVAGETRIPAGRYEIKLRRGTPMGKRYDKLYSEVGHDGMLELQGVDNFSFIYIHIGNDEADTEGCLLVNYNSYLDPVNGGGSGGRSTDAYLDLYRIIYPKLVLGEKVYITIKDEGVK